MVNQGQTPKFGAAERANAERLIALAWPKTWAKQVT